MVINYFDSNVKDVIMQRFNSAKLPFPADKLTNVQLKELGAKGKMKINLANYVKANKGLLANLTDKMYERIERDFSYILFKNSTKEERNQWNEELKAEGYAGLYDFINYIEDGRSIIKSVYIN